MPRNTITSNRQRAESLSRTLRARAEIRRAVRRCLADRLETIRNEVPPCLPPAAQNAWPHEVARIIERLKQGDRP